MMEVRFPLCIRFNAITRTVVLIIIAVTVNSSIPTADSSKITSKSQPSQFHHQTWTPLNHSRIQNRLDSKDVSIKTPTKHNTYEYKHKYPNITWTMNKLDSLPYLFFQYSNYSNRSHPYIILVGDDKDKLEVKLTNNYSSNRLGDEKDNNTNNTRLAVHQEISDSSFINSTLKSYNNKYYNEASAGYTNSYNYTHYTNGSNKKIQAAQSESRGDTKERVRKTLSTSTAKTTEKVSGENDGPWINDLTWDDATWILTASFIIFTMQTGFGMLESGCVSVRNESNIMMKNVVDVVFGGLTYWLFGFSISFGTDAGSTPYFGIGEYLVDSDNNLMGPVFASFMFQLSFATTATTIVSGTMAERCNFKAYCVFSLLNTIVYCVPARWVWGPTGFLGEMGAIDIAGSGAVHLLGGVSGFTAAWLLGPRLGRYDNGPASLPLGNPTSCIVGLYILWWGWLAFNSGSTFGVSGAKWKFAARAATTTLIASIGGGVVGSLWTLIKPGRIFEVMDIVNPVLGALVAITAGCALFHTVDAFIVGIVGGVVVLATNWIPDALRVDDPVGATAVHAFAGVWGLVAVAIFAEEDQGLGFTKGHAGFLRGGDFYLMKVQLFAALCITLWSCFISFTLLWVINKFVPIRMEPHEELLGADLVEHMLLRREFQVMKALVALSSDPEVQDMRDKSQFVGSCNPVHEVINDKIKNLGKASRWKRLKAKTVAASAFMTILQETHSRRASIAPAERDCLPTIIVQSQSQTTETQARPSYDIVQDYLGSPFTISDRVPYQNHNNYNNINNIM